MQFTGIVKCFDEDAGEGIIVRDRDRYEIVVTSRGLAIGVTTLFEDERVEFDVDMGVAPQARNVIRV